MSNTNYFLNHTGAQLDEAIQKVLDDYVPSSEKDAAYDEGYESGHNAGYDTGYDVGYNEGYTNGYNAEKPYSSELPYIESTGTQYINTGMPCTRNTKAVVEFTVTVNDNTARSILGTAQGSVYTTPCFAISCYQGGTFCFNSAGEGWNTCDFVVGQKHHAVLDKTGGYLDGVKVFDTSGYTSDFTTSPLYLFAFNYQTPTEFGSLKMYYCKLYENDILIHDYIPVLDNDGVPCLYDKITNTFAYNNGTGNFRYPGGGSIVNSITTSGTYDDAEHHGNIFGAIDQSGNLLLMVEGGTTSSYENIIFSTTSVPDGVALANYSFPNYTSNQVSRAHIAVFSGVTGSVNLALDFNSRNSTYDRVTCAVTMTYV